MKTKREMLHLSSSARQLHGFHCEGTGYAKEAQLVNKTKGQLSSRVTYDGLLRAFCLPFSAPFINTGVIRVLKSQDIGGDRGQHQLHTMFDMSPWMSAFISTKRCWTHPARFSFTEGEQMTTTDSP